MWEKAKVGWFERIALKMYITICKMDDQCKFNSWSRALKAGALGQPRGMGWGEIHMEVHMYTHDWFMLMYGKNYLQLNIFLKKKNALILKTNIKFCFWTCWLKQNSFPFKIILAPSFSPTTNLFNLNALYTVCYVLRNSTIPTSLHCFNFPDSIISLRI